MSTLGDDGGWPKRHRRRPLSPGRGVSANFYPSESRHPLWNSHHQDPIPPSPAPRGTNVSLTLSENHHGHRSQATPGTNISGGIMSSVGGSQNIDTDHDNHNFKGTQNNNYGININIQLHIHLGSGPDSTITLTRVSFGLFGRGDTMILGWF